MPFQLESNCTTAGRPGAGDCQTDEVARGGQSASDFAWRDRLRQDIHNVGKCHSGDRSADPGHFAQQNAGRAALLRVKQFFPRNAVEYFVSYFDYYQPEAYIPRSDTYIEKDSSINEEIERLRLSATSALLSRRDVIVVASVSCIYGITSPEDYERMLLTVKRGQRTSREAVLGRLVDMLYERNDMNFSRGRFRVRGDVVEVYPATADEQAVRIEIFW